MGIEGRGGNNCVCACVCACVRACVCMCVYLSTDHMCMYVRFIWK